MYIIVKYYVFFVVVVYIVIVFNFIFKGWNNICDI